MDALKGFAEIAEHILYEALGLVLPGAIFVLAVAFALDPAHGHSVVEVAQRHPWLSLGGAYVVGYPVQSLSRPLTTAFEWLLQRPTRLLAATGWLLEATTRRTVGAQVAAFEGSLLRRHAHQHAHQHAPEDRDAWASRSEPVAGAAAPVRVDFAGLMHDRWARQLELPDEHRLTEQQVKDLCYSALTGDERKSLIRFRAAASLTRGVSTAVVVVTLILALMLVQQPARLTWSAVAVIELLIVAFYGLMERGDMYDRLWSTVLQSQALGVGAHARCLPPAARANGSTVEQRAPSAAREFAGAAAAPAESLPHERAVTVPAVIAASSVMAASPHPAFGDGVAVSPTTAHLPSSTRTPVIVDGGASSTRVPQE